MIVERIYWSTILASFHNSLVSIFQLNCFFFLLLLFFSLVFQQNQIFVCVSYYEFNKILIIMIIHSYFFWFFFFLEKRKTFDSTLLVIILPVWFLHEIHLIQHNKVYIIIPFHSIELNLLFRIKIHALHCNTKLTYTNRI